MSDLRFRFGPLETRGLLLGLRGGQMAALLAGAAVAVVGMASLPLALGACVGVVSVVAGVASAFLGMRGPGVDEWAPIVVRRALRAIAGRNRRIPDWHLAGHRRLSDGSTAEGRLGRGHGPLSGLRIIELPGAVRGRDLGIVSDAATGTSTAVIALRGGGFALLSDHEKERRLSWWAGVLDGLCRDGSTVRRLQWVERAVAGGELHRADDRGSADPAKASYAELLSSAAPSMQHHEVMLALQLEWRRCARAIRAADRRERARGAGIVLAREVEAMLLRLDAGGAQTAHAQGADELTDALVTGLGIKRRGRSRDVGDSTVLDEPSAARTRWDRFVVDGTQHATYWIREWPRVDVGPDFLGSLLLQTVATRVVAVTMAFDPPGRAQREADAALTAELADDDMRRRAGFVSGFRRRRERDEVARRGEEIAEGHGSVRFSAYITVSAPVSEALEPACADVELRAQQSHLELQRLYGQQDVAVTYTLPLARGLR